jgi:hypothetical protein
MNLRNSILGSFESTDLKPTTLRRSPPLELCISAEMDTWYLLPWIQGVETDSFFFHGGPGSLEAERWRGPDTRSRPRAQELATRKYGLVLPRSCDYCWVNSTPTKSRDLKCHLFCSALNCGLDDSCTTYGTDGVTCRSHLAPGLAWRPKRLCSSVGRLCTFGLCPSQRVLGLSFRSAQGLRWLLRLHSKCSKRQQCTSLMISETEHFSCIFDHLHVFFPECLFSF